MHPIGFTTGGFFKVGTIKALDILEKSSFVSIEISLRDEFLTLKDSIASMDFSRYDNISFHLPKLVEISEKITEEELVRMSLPFKERGWDIVLHPDKIEDFSLWEEFGSQLCIENMESRKSAGKTVEEMEAVFNKLPNASMCFDIGHAQQMDTTMELGKRMCSKFYDRIKIIHFSDVFPDCSHHPITESTLELFSPVMDLTPKESSIVLEYALDRDIGSETDFIREKFPEYGIDVRL